jgi:excisionase family DNA binding protein
MRPTNIRPTGEEQRVAVSSLEAIAKTLRSTEEDGTIFLEIGNEHHPKQRLEIPKKALTILQDVLKLLATGKGFSLLADEEELSTQEAADLLKVSRPYLVQLLEAGAIPHKKIGTHRRILLKDLIAYAKQQQLDLDKALTELTKQAQELNLGY